MHVSLDCGNSLFTHPSLNVQSRSHLLRKCPLSYLTAVIRLLLSRTSLIVQYRPYSASLQFSLIVSRIPFLVAQSIHQYRFQTSPILLAEDQARVVFASDHRLGNLRPVRNMHTDAFESYCAFCSPLYLRSWTTYIPTVSTLPSMRRNSLPTVHVPCSLLVVTSLHPFRIYIHYAILRRRLYAFRNFV
ncbi:hypothetical protein K505DRAFT_35964 [Melanomma pulvis-pyrius CBS 109.77]|uniref:Uncharacterized protein n=1 Tax=Melanomma pulvis-pyrius CBS 109.77 TaxID=1314802 RepID=A0A6A6XBT9_9PLEO|nr:hypothetical protein K505DRAFT_35964 [Melanomma pulvis-pyrius CBS 109.77]